MEDRRGWKKQIISRLTRDKSRCSRYNTRLARVEDYRAADRIRQHIRQPWTVGGRVFSSGIYIMHISI